MLMSFPALRALQPDWAMPERPSGLGLSPSLDPLTHRFAVWAGREGGTSVDIGCGGGIAAAAALVRGARVVAIDPDTSNIEPLLAQLPVRQRAHLRVLGGRLPTLQFESASLTAIHAARVLHLLEGNEIRQSLRQFRGWLRPDGRLFISVLTPHGSHWAGFHREYARRCENDEVWPGAADSRRPHLLDQRVLQRELTRAGFRVDELLDFPLAWDATQMCCGIVAAPQTISSDSAASRGPARRYHQIRR
ncbi:MAG: class I SAM-dependent methyltransferase [Proteobacteria bacterium]|nr:class I SAM-dependent methyltransferase [Pseudomonadota bacterium]